MPKSERSKLDFPDRAALEVITSNHESRGDQLVERIKSKKSPKGQFGTGTIMIATAIAAVLVSLPAFLGFNDIPAFWIGAAFLSSLVAPMLGFTTAMIAKAAGFKSVPRKWIGLGIGCAASLPFILSILYWNEIHGFLVLLPCWLVQFAAIYIAHRVDKG